MFSKKKQFTISSWEKSPGFPFQTSADSWIRQASKWLGPWHQAPLLPAPWSSWFWGARGAVWMNLPVSALNGKHHSGFTIWNDKKNNMFGLFHATLRDGHASSHFFLPKIIHSKCQRWYKTTMFQTSLSTCMSTFWHWKLPFSFDPTSLQDLSVSMPPGGVHHA